MTAVRRPPDIVVAVPAHDESASIGDCLQSVMGAVDVARHVDAVSRVVVAVAAHRCADDTAEVARLVLGEAGVDHQVLELDEAMPVGAVRTRLIAAALTDWGRTDGWLFSTDADSVVPPDWITSLLAVADERSADLVAGLTSLVGWEADERAHRAYRRVLSAGMTVDGHRHVYAANLAVRLAMFAAVGGFPALPHGEEQGLVDAVRARGGVVVGAVRPVVATSGRMPGRAESGLGALLRSLSETDQDTVQPVRATRPSG